MCTTTISVLPGFQRNTRLPWQPNKAKETLACLGETSHKRDQRCLGSRKRQTDTIVTVKCEICYFSVRAKNTLDMLISKLAPLSTNIDTTSDLQVRKNLKIPRQHLKGAARRDVFASAGVNGVHAVRSNAIWTARRVRRGQERNEDDRNSQVISGVMNLPISGK